VARTEGGVAYAVTGSGPPLVYVGGWVSHLELSWALPAERAFYDALAQGRTLIRYDKLGCGLSARTPPGEYSMAQELDALDDVTADLETFDLIGTSLGAAVAATFAARQPQKIQKLILYGGWLDGSRVAAPAIRMHVLGLVTQHWGLASGLLADVFAPEADAGTRAAFVRYQQESADAETARTMLAAAYATDLTEVLPRIVAPTLVVHRDRDRAAPLSEGKRLADGIQGARFEVIQGRSHLPYIGDTSALTRAIRRFLGLPARHRGSGPALTARQREVAALVAQGCTNREIGARLGIAERSAEAHVERIRLRMDFRSRAQIAAWYVATAAN
jgi:pimeloyl-ACP methyl ester carboxylesterase/DNA-binding CsgD family transcriptional regulator